MTGPSNIAADLVAAVKDLRDAQQNLAKYAREAAVTERSYRRAKAIAFLRSPGRNVAEREANAEMYVVEEREDNQIMLGDVRYKRDLAEGLRVSAQEAVRSHRQIVSALQSLAGLERSEADLARYGGQAWGAGEG